MLVRRLVRLRGWRGNSRATFCFITSSRAASTRCLVGVQFVEIVRCDLFAGSDFSEGVNKDPLFKNNHGRVRLARMIDVLGAVAASASINGPIRIDITDALCANRAPSALSFSQRNSFSHIFSDPLVMMEWNRGETSFSVYSGFPYRESDLKSLNYHGTLIPADSSGSSVRSCAMTIVSRGTGRSRSGRSL